MNRKGPVDMANEVLLELNMRTPDAIDVDLIASHLDALLCYEPLFGCAGRIVGVGDSAIITVDSNSSPARRRFTGAHEVGHWVYDKGVSTACTKKHISSGWAGGRESRANKFAAALLLPHHMLNQYVHPLIQVTFETVESVSRSFRTSTSATLIRIVESAQFPVVVVCTHNTHRKWFARSKYVPDELYPDVNIGRHTLLASLSGHGYTQGMVGAEQWFAHAEVSAYEVMEETLSYPGGYAYTIISWPCEEMVLDMM